MCKDHFGEKPVAVTMINTRPWVGLWMGRKHTVSVINLI